MYKDIKSESTDLIKIVTTVSNPDTNNLFEYIYNIISAFSNNLKNITNKSNDFWIDLITIIFCLNSKILKNTIDENNKTLDRDEYIILSQSVRDVIKYIIEYIGPIKNIKPISLFKIKGSHLSNYSNKITKNATMVICNSCMRVKAHQLMQLPWPIPSQYPSQYRPQYRIARANLPNPLLLTNGPNQTILSNKSTIPTIIIISIMGVIGALALYGIYNIIF